jgi:hypothetical protein
MLRQEVLVLEASVHYRPQLTVMNYDKTIRHLDKGTILLVVVNDVKDITEIPSKPSKTIWY